MNSSERSWKGKDGRDDKDDRGRREYENDSI